MKMKVIKTFSESWCSGATTRQTIILSVVGSYKGDGEKLIMKPCRGKKHMLSKKRTSEK
jgi:hypothetical protein